MVAMKAFININEEVSNSMIILYAGLVLTNTSYKYLGIVYSTKLKFTLAKKTSATFLWL